MLAANSLTTDFKSLFMIVTSMANRVIDTKKLETILQSKWSEFLDKSQLMRVVLEYARDAEYRVLRQSEPPSQQVKLSVTKFTIKQPLQFEVWVEFTVPKDNGVVIGTHVLTLLLTGEVELEETYGTHFLPETP